METPPGGAGSRRYLLVLETVTGSHLHHLHSLRVRPGGRGSGAHLARGKSQPSPRSPRSPPATAPLGPVSVPDPSTLCPGAPLVPSPPGPGTPGPSVLCPSTPRSLCSWLRIPSRPSAPGSDPLSSRSGAPRPRLTHPGLPPVPFSRRAGAPLPHGPQRSRPAR